MRVVTPPWPIRSVFFDLPPCDDATVLDEIARYARSHPDRTITIRRSSIGAARDAAMPVNVLVIDSEPAAWDLDVVVSCATTVVDAYRRRNTFAVLLGGAGAASATMDDLIDDILPVPGQPDTASCSSRDTNALPSRDQSNLARAAS